MRRAIFLDRDGVVNFDSPDFIKGPDEAVLIPGSAEAVRSLCEAGFACIVVSNQSGMARGLVSLESLSATEAKLRSEIEKTGGRIEAFYHCPHGPEEGCGCRKPEPGMLLRAAQELGIELRASWMVGDRESDIACGRRAGCQTVLVYSGKTPPVGEADFETRPDFACPSLREAAAVIQGLKPHP
jgi:D-glycero-D-manno-heptose 1,7-bisphosphate phosphatase